MARRLVEKRRRSRKFGTTDAIRGILIDYGTIKPETAARRFLADRASEFGLATDLKHLRFERACGTRFGYHVFFQQTHLGYRIRDAWVRVDLDSRRRIVGANLRSAPTTFLQRAGGSSRTNAALKAAQAVDIASHAIGRETSQAEILESPQLVYTVRRSRLREAWKICLRITETVEDWAIQVDANSGHVLGAQLCTFGADGAGLVFDPNPIVATNNLNLDGSTPISRSAYSQVVLRDLNGSGLLDGKFVTTAATPTPRVRRADGRFLVERDQRGFGEVMAYYHIDTCQRYMQQLGFRHAHSTPVKVAAGGSLGQNSVYSQLTDTITLATGGIPDAEDAEIIIHEYAHAIHSAINQAFGKDSVSVNLAEGFCDYVALSFFEGKKPQAILKPLFATWDSRGDGGTAVPSYLRRANVPTHFTQIRRNLDGRDDRKIQFWSTCLWDVRTLFGKEHADTIIIGSLYLIEKNANSFSYFKAARAIVDANLKAYADDRRAQLLEIFRDRGIFQ